MDYLQRQAIRNAESMKMFERDGFINYGVWRDWHKASPENKVKIKANFDRSKANADKIESSYGASIVAMPKVTEAQQKHNQYLKALMDIRKSPPIQKPSAWQRFKLWINWR